MVKRLFPLILLFLFLSIFLSACSPTFCSTPYILSEGDCCLDKNNDGTCDQQRELSTEENQEYAASLEQSSSSPTPSLSQPLRTTEEGVLLTVDRDDDPSKGAPDSAVLLLAFADYTDSNSQRFHNEVLPQIMDKYGSRITYVFRNFPETNNENAQLAAEASECADEQGKFWEYHDYLFAHSSRLTLSSLRQFAGAVGLDVDAFEACFFSHRYKDEVLADKKDGLAYGVSHLPTFFLNNNKIIGYKSFDKFDALLEDIFYAELRAERGTTFTAQSTGLAYTIKAGPAALDPTISQSPYSNSLELVDAVFSVAARDITPRDSSASKDSASLAVTYSSKYTSLTGRDVYTITLTDLLSEGISHTFYGGVGTEVPVHGNTGVGTRYLPRSDAYLTFWGLAAIKKNGEPFVPDAFVHFLVTRGIRDSSHRLLSAQEDDDLEAYLLISGSNQEQLPFPDGFLYLFWPDVNIRQS